ncbi:hypothetical protein [Streptosporangium sp. NPDC001681]|uniref:hypothetical protein n=1 Tax=Streptosporangium sp. NPDC001681 TaxID=3154395 RepID=UPI00331AA27E
MVELLLWGGVQGWASSLGLVGLVGVGGVVVVLLGGVAVLLGGGGQGLGCSLASLKLEVVVPSSFILLICEIRG